MKNPREGQNTYENIVTDVVIGGMNKAIDAEGIKEFVYEVASESHFNVR